MNNERAREAALAIHALLPMDQARVLAELTSAQRSIVAPLVVELAELGIPRSVAKSESQSGVRSGPLTSTQRLMGLSAHAAAKALSFQDATTIAVVLSSAHWPWKSEAMDLLATDKRLAVQGELHGAPACSPAVREAFLDEMARATGQDLSSRHAMRNRSNFFHKVMSWMR